MKKILMDEEELVGRTVSKLTSGYGYLCIHFTDGTCALFCVESSDESAGVYVTTYVPKLPALRAYLGLISDKEHKELVADEARKQEEQELADFTRLKAKFEPAKPAGHILRDGK